MKKIRVTIWNEFIHEKQQDAVGELIRSFYPEGLHKTLAEKLASDEFETRAVALDEHEQGLPDDILNTTDVLIWWGHGAHAAVKDELVVKIKQRILRNGMGLIVLHSGHLSKIFCSLMGTDCRLRWREVGEKERLWVVAPSHPIAKGIPETFTIPNHEMYGEPFDIPDDGKIVFMSWFEGGNVFRSGVAFDRGKGKVFYFSPGHETFPIFHDPTILQVIGNAIRWAAPEEEYADRITAQPEALEKIYTPNPLANIDTHTIH